MALPAGQRYRLDMIENSLRASDPQLAALFTIFSRLGQDEQVPRTEDLATGPGRAALVRLRQFFRPATTAGRRGSRPRARIRAVLFVPAALAVMACGVWLGSSLSSSPRCAVLPRTIGIPQLIASGKAKARTLSGALVEAAGAGRAKASAACSAIGWPAYR